RRDARLHGGLHAYRERLNQRALGERYAVGHLESVGLRMHGVGREHAMDRRRRPKADLGIDVVHADPGSAGRRIRHARLHADAVALLERGHFGAGLDDDTGRLVTQHHRRPDDKITDAAVGVVVDVAAAYADRVDCDLDV